MRLAPLKRTVLRIHDHCLGLLKRHKRPYHELDQHIAPLVGLMNRHDDIQTVASCQGHPFGTKSPYIYFKSPVQTAQQLEVFLREACMGRQLNYFWSIKGIFDDQCQLTFLLYSPELDQHVHSLLRSTLTFCLLRSQLDHDFEFIGHSIGRIPLHLNRGETP